MRLIWAPEARNDLADAVAYVAERNVTAAFDMEDRVLETVERLREMPLSGRRGRFGDHRERPVRRTPYLVIYTANRDEIEVMRIWHGSRRPYGDPAD